MEIYMYISHASKLMLKILHARLQQYMKLELPNVQAGFRKGRRTRYQIVIICWIVESKTITEKKKTFNFATLTMLKLLTM